MKVYRIKHLPTGLYVSSTFGFPDLYGLTRVGKIYTKKCQSFDKYDKHPDYTILWDEIKD